MAQLCSGRDAAQSKVTQNVTTFRGSLAVPVDKMGMNHVCFLKLSVKEVQIYLPDGKPCTP